MHRFPHPLYVSFSSLAREKKNALFRIQQKSEWAFGVFEFQDGSLLQSFWAYPCHRLCWRSSLKTGSWLGLIIHSPTVWWSHTLRGDRWIDAALWQRSVPSQNDTLTSPYSSFSKQTYCYKHIRLFFLWTSLSCPKNSYFKPYAAYMWSNDSQSVGKGAIGILPM